MKTTDMKSFKDVVRKTLKEFTVDKDGKPVHKNNSFEDVIAKHGYEHSEYDSVPGGQTQNMYFKRGGPSNSFTHVITHFVKKNYTTSYPYHGVGPVKSCDTPEKLDQHLTDLHK